MEGVGLVEEPGLLAVANVLYCDLVALFQLIGVNISLIEEARSGDDDKKYVDFFGRLYSNVYVKLRIVFDILLLELFSSGLGEFKVVFAEDLLANRVTAPSLSLRKGILFVVCKLELELFITAPRTTILINWTCEIHQVFVRDCIRTIRIPSAFGIARPTTIRQVPVAVASLDVGHSAPARCLAEEMAFLALLSRIGHVVEEAFGQE